VGEAGPALPAHCPLNTLGSGFHWAEGQGGHGCRGESSIGSVLMVGWMLALRRRSLFGRREVGERGINQRKPKSKLSLTTRPGWCDVSETLWTTADRTTGFPSGLLSLVTIPSKRNWAPGDRPDPGEEGAGGKTT